MNVLEIFQDEQKVKTIEKIIPDLLKEVNVPSHVVKNLKCIRKHCSQRNALLSLLLLVKAYSHEQLSKEEMRELKRLCTDKKEILCQIKKCPFSTREQTNFEKSMKDLIKVLPSGTQGKKVESLLKKELALRKKIKKNLETYKSKSSRSRSKTRHHPKKKKI